MRLRRPHGLANPNGFDLSTVGSRPQPDQQVAPLPDCCPEGAVVGQLGAPLGPGVPLARATRWPGSRLTFQLDDAPALPLDDVVLRLPTYEPGSLGDAWFSGLCHYEPGLDQ